MILYAGNKLAAHGNTPTTVDTLGPLLAKQYEIYTCSDKKNKMFRLIDFVYQITRHRKHLNLILIDTYSTANFYFAFACSLVARAYAIPYVPILHGGSLPKRVKKSMYISKMIFGKAYVNISPSKYLYEHFNNLGYSTEYIPNNIDLSQYEFKWRREIAPRLLYVRAFHKIYNPKLAVRVFKKVLKSHPDATLCMVGPDKDGSLSEVKDFAKELGVFDNMVFTGRLEKNEWIALSEDYDIFINTTDYDNQPVSVIEAMALGFPIISTDAGGLPYLIEDGVNGVIVPRNDAEAMCHAIETLIDSPEVSEKLSVGAKNTSKEFDWERVREQWHELISKFEKPKGTLHADV